MLAHFSVEGYSYSRSLRLLTPADFKSVFNQPTRAGSPQMTLLASPNQADHPRLGVTIAKKNVKTSVQRNRIKRQLREFLRLNQHKLPAVDMVVVVKRGADKLPNSELFSLMEGLCRTLKRRLPCP